MSEGIGLYRGPNAIPDNLSPGASPSQNEVPVTGEEGPSIAIAIEDWQKHLAMIDKVGEYLNATTRPDFIEAASSAQTDSSGNCFLGLYQVAQGMEARLHRLTVNALIPATGIPYTAAGTFAAANAYLEIHTADSPQTSSIGFQTLRDFAPPTAGGPIFPGLFTDNSNQSMLCRGPMWFVLKVVGTSALANTQVMARYQLSLSRARGVV